MYETMFHIHSKQNSKLCLLLLVPASSASWILDVMITVFELSNDEYFLNLLSPNLIPKLISSYTSVPRHLSADVPSSNLLYLVKYCY
jgi:hypothetical protein